MINNLIPYFGIDNVRVMLFVDGENLSIRFGSMLRNRDGQQVDEVVYRKDTYVWNPYLSGRNVVVGGGILRTHYYTAVQGDQPTVEEVARELKNANIDAPRVFKKSKGARSKRVDITLATEMLLHATRKNYDIAVLVAGDEDYVPLVQAVQSEGRGVHVWSIPDGLNQGLVHASDKYVDISPYLIRSEA
jgi:uncharacterized LabA/DUF88 family protein